MQITRKRRKLPESEHIYIPCEAIISTELWDKVQERLKLNRRFSTGNAKNFVIACLADQAYYFDEVEDRVSFPDMVPVSFISSALFEKDMADNVDFRQTPMAHARHNISIDRRLVKPTPWV